MDRETAKETIKRQISVRKYLKKAEQGSYCCPFCGSGTHKGGTGALAYYEDTNTVHCFSCGKTADSIDIFMEGMGCDFNTALLCLADELHITIDNEQSKREKPIAIKEKAPAAVTSNTEPPTDYTDYYKKCAQGLADPRAKAYIEGRGISIETARACGIGFDAAADPARSNHPAARIIIPTSKYHFVGRSIDPNTPAQYAKMNPKGAHPGIFNEAAIYNSSIVFITEGAFDALSILEAGEAAIALNSTSNARAFLEKLDSKPAAAKFVIATDNDTAGNKATAELSAGFKLRGITYTTAALAGAYKDPNEALKAEPIEFKTRVKEAAKMAENMAAGNYVDDFLAKVQGETYKPYKTGLKFFDDLLGGGIMKQTLLLLMAAPGTGKTTLCQQITEAMAAGGRRAMYLNLEMSREQMLAKALSCRLAQRGKFYSMTDILQGYNWSEQQRAEITAEAEAYKREIFPYLQYNSLGLTSDLEEILKRLHEVGETAKKNGTAAPAVVLDYLHLVSSNKITETQELIKQTVTGLKQYAIDYDTFVIGIVATNRDSNKGGRITLESGRDSSNIEYTADYALSLNYFDIDNGKVSPTEVEKIAELQTQTERQMIIRVLKARSCAPGRSAKVWYNAKCNYYAAEDDFRPFIGNSPFDKKEPATRRL